jgi:hypothetical protein
MTTERHCSLVDGQIVNGRSWSFNQVDNAQRLITRTHLNDVVVGGFFWIVLVR